MTTRQKKTPAQRAAETLAAANRRVNKLSTRYDALEHEQLQVGRELDEAIKARDYAAENPALEPAQEDEAEQEELAGHGEGLDG